MIQRYIYFLGSVTLFLFVAASSHRSPTESRSGIFGSTTDTLWSSVIKFSHKFHIEEVGAQCIDCHEGADTSTRSSDNILGKMSNCAACHDVEDAEQCLTCHISNEMMVGFENPTREIRFSHEAHVIGQNVACETCHAGVEKVDLATHDNMPGMATCSTCHNDRKVTNTCESCHTDFVARVPSDHRESGFLRNHRETARLGGLETSCQSCHTETFCQDCHQGAGLKLFGRKDPVTEPRSKVFTKDDAAQMTLQEVHELNYRFTHGIDAKSKKSDCASCHTVQTFCAQCHEAGGNVTRGNFKPASHSVAGFTTLGFGSGGGLHAEEARRDIESCMSCHDIEGRDPTCFTCHTESGRAR